MSGDLQQDDGPNFVNSADNSYNVVLARNVDASAALDGFTVTVGNNNDELCALLCSGGGMLTGESSLTVRNIVFRDNQAKFGGGGMYNYQSSPTLINVTFSGNQAPYAGGMYNNRSNAMLTNILFSGNQADIGGGVFNERSSPVLTNVIFSGNRAETNGGGMVTGAGNIVLTNVVIAGNYSGNNGGALYSSDTTLVIQNSIFWDNVPFPIFDDGDTTFTFRHTLVQDLGAAFLNSSSTDSGGNLDGTNASNDPRFAAPQPASAAPTSAGDYRLLSGSPAIDAGDNDLVPVSVTTDLQGLPRIRNGTVDLGVYEIQSGNKATPTLIWANPAAITYGTALGASQLNATADVAGSFAYTPTTGTLLDAGVSQTLQTVFTPSDPNYVTVTETVQLNVLPAALTVTADDQIRKAGTPNPALTISYTGFVNGDDASVLDNLPTATTTADETSSVGTYPITPSGGNAANYSFSYVDGTLTVADQDIPLITWADPAAITYGTALDASHLNATANVAGSFAYTPTVGTVLGAGNGQLLQAVFTPDDQATYATVTKTVQLDVQPALLTVTADAAMGVVGEPLPTLGYRVSGLVNGDTMASVFTTAPTLATTTTASSATGNYPVTANGAVAPNYAITYVNGMLTLRERGAPTAIQRCFYRYSGAKKRLGTPKGGTHPWGPCHHRTPHHYRLRNTSVFRRLGLDLLCGHLTPRAASIRLQM